MSLLDGLVSYWKLDEASGNAIDAHSSNDLVETSGTIASTTGKINGGRDFEAGDTEYFTRATNASLNTGDIDFTVAAWINLETATTGTILAKFNTAGDTESEYFLDINSSQARFFVRIAAGTANASVTASTFGNLSTGTWYHVMGWHDAAANTLNVSVNGTANSTAHSTGVDSGTAAFLMGSRTAGSNLLDGIIDEVGFWKRVLTSDERAALYNGGAGLSYNDFGDDDQVIALGQAVETDTAQAIARSKTQSVGQAVETDTAGTITLEGGIEVALNQAVETDTAQALTHAKVKAVGQAVETDTARAISRTTVVEVGFALETSTAQAIAWAPRHRLVGCATETDTAFTFTPLFDGEVIAPPDLNLSGPTSPAQALAGAIASSGPRRPGAIPVRVLTNPRPFWPYWDRHWPHS